MIEFNKHNDVVVETQYFDWKWHELLHEESVLKGRREEALPGCKLCR